MQHLQKRRSRLSSTLVVFSGLLLGCQSTKKPSEVPVGYDQGRQSIPGTEFPVRTSDYPEITKRGRKLAVMSEILQLGRQAISGMRVPDQSLTYLVEVDPGLNSGQVTFFQVGVSIDTNGQPSKTLNLNRWTRVAVTVQPKKVLAVDAVTEPIVPDSIEYIRLLSKQTVENQHRNLGTIDKSNVFAIAETVTTTRKNKTVEMIQSRVYWFGWNPESSVVLQPSTADSGHQPFTNTNGRTAVQSDQEFVIYPPTKRTSAHIQSHTVVQTSQVSPLRNVVFEVKTLEPHPMSICRILRQNEADKPTKVMIRSQKTGQTWQISPQTGDILAD